MQNLLPGDKLQTTYSPVHYKVIARKGPVVTLKCQQSGKLYERNVAHVKKISVDTSNPKASNSIIPVSQEDSFTGDNTIVNEALNVANNPSEDSVSKEVDSFAGDKEIDPGSGRPIRVRQRPKKLDDYHLTE